MMGFLLPESMPAWVREVYRLFREQLRAGELREVERRYAALGEELFRMRQLQARIRAFQIRLSGGQIVDIDEWGRIVASDPYESPATFLPRDPDGVATLLDLARAGNEADFKDLAAALGVQKIDLAPLWDGTTARLRKE